MANSQKTYQIIKRYKQKVKDLKEELEYVRQQLDEVEADRAKFRDHFVIRFKWWIKLIGEKSSPNLAWLIENEAQWLRNLKPWSW